MRLLGGVGNSCSFGAASDGAGACGRGSGTGAIAGAVALIGIAAVSGTGAAEDCTAAGTRAAARSGATPSMPVEMYAGGGPGGSGGRISEPIITRLAMCASTSGDQGGNSAVVTGRGGPSSGGPGDVAAL